MLTIIYTFFKYLPQPNINFCQRLSSDGIAVTPILGDNCSDIHSLNLVDSLCLTDNHADFNRLCREDFSCLFVSSDNNSNELTDINNVQYILENYEDIETDFFIGCFKRFHSIPWNIADTDRCVIREFGMDDIPVLFSLYSQKSNFNYLKGLPSIESELPDFLKAYIHNMYDFMGFGLWLIEHKASGEIIGLAGFDIDEESELPSLGYLIDTKHQKKGYAYEICTTLINYGFNQLGFDSIMAECDSKNIPSLNLLKKLGFHITSSSDKAVKLRLTSLSSQE